MVLEVGSLLYNRYRIERILAQGGMGAIYRAVDESLGVTVAVKENLFSSDESSRQFRREATILASLRHANLPRVTDHFVLPGQGQYLVMDFIEGEDLKQRISRVGILPEEEAVLIVVAVCDALDYMHQLNPPIVHRDIKPGNIKITPKGEPHLVDFGLAKMASQDSHTTVGAQALTPGYAPPEQYGKGTDPRSDIYSLGATLYAALTGKVPEDGLARAMGSAQLTPIHTYNPKISQRLEAVVNKAMAVMPGERYQTVDAFKQDLLNANTGAYRKANQMETIRVAAYPMHGDPLSAGATLPAYGTAPQAPGTLQPGSVSTGGVSQPQYQAAPPSKMKMSYGIAVLIVAAVVIVGVAVVGGLIWYARLLDTNKTAQLAATNTALAAALQLTAADTTAQVAEARAETLAPTATLLPQETPTPAETATATLTFTPAATLVGGGTGQIAFASNRSGVFQIWLMDPDGGNLQMLTEMTDGACTPAWSADGQRLAFISPCRKRSDDYEGSGIFLINADGSGLIPLASRPGGDFDPAWSPDGTRIAYTSLRDGPPHIYVFNLSDNSEVNLSNVSTRDRRPDWSPDGNWIVFETTRGGQPQIWTIPLDGSDKPREFSVYASGTAFRPDWSPDGDNIFYSQGSSLPALFSKSFLNKANPEHKVSDLRPVWDVDVSKDGYWLVFESIQELNNRDIYRMMSNGGNMVRLTDDKADDINPVWRP